MKRVRPTPEFVSLLYMALEEDIGIIVEAIEPPDGAEKLRERLYAERRKDPLFSVLSIVRSPDAPKKELWIVRSKREPNGEEI